MQRYVDSHPYTVRSVIEDDGQAYRLHFTAGVQNTEIPVIAADVVHNIRSGLDHLAAALVPPQCRGDGAFPILWHRVWEPDVQGEDKQRTRARKRWRDLTRHMDPGAVAVLKEYQPPDARVQPIGTLNLLSVINKLSNTDKHEQFPTHVPGLRYPVTVRCRQVDGRPGEGVVDQGPDRLVEDQTDIQGLPEGAVDVEIEGAPLVALRVRGEHGYVPIPSFFRDGIEQHIRGDLFPRLVPFVHPAP